MPFLSRRRRRRSHLLPPPPITPTPASSLPAELRRSAWDARRFGTWPSGSEFRRRIGSSGHRFLGPSADEPPFGIALLPAEASFASCW
uniref:Uncharacterized protein n=1 Tax=Arundo donax TaxID=35708 RepID=A0A0A9CZV6_ARUDO